MRIGTRSVLFGAHCVRRWVEEHKDGKPDTWTPQQGIREPFDRSGVWSE